MPHASEVQVAATASPVRQDSGLSHLMRIDAVQKGTVFKAGIRAIWSSGLVRPLLGFDHADRYKGPINEYANNANTHCHYSAVPVLLPWLDAIRTQRRYRTHLEFVVSTSTVVEEDDCKESD